MAYSGIIKPSANFNTLAYTANGTNPRTITGLGHQPGWLWFKSRESGAIDHATWDVVRGVTTGVIHPNTTAMQNTTQDHGKISAVTSDGFTTIDGPSGSYPRLWTNDNNAFGTGADDYVVWSWKLGGTPSSNSDGSVTASVSADQAAGVSIASFTGTESAITVGHGLNATPTVWWLKRYTDDGYANTSEWYVKFPKQAAVGSNKYLTLQSSAVNGSNDGSLWPQDGNTQSTNSVVHIGNNANSNHSGTSVLLYSFAEKPGFSKFGCYIGNGSNTDGIFNYCGFKPALIIVKRVAGSTDDWRMVDNKRDISNNHGGGSYRWLYPSANTAEASDNASGFDLLSNGFKVRSDSAGVNANGNDYFYMAFAEEPLVSNVGVSGIPATAK